MWLLKEWPCRSQPGQDQQLDRARVRGGEWKFPTSQNKTETAKARPYLHAERAVAFTENHHLVGVDELLYSGFEIILPGFVVDWRHFEDNSTCLRRQASKDGWWEGHQSRLNNTSSPLLSVTRCQENTRRQLITTHCRQLICPPRQMSSYFFTHLCRCTRLHPPSSPK